MTLAALSPLYTWWPLFFALLAFFIKVVCPAIVRRQSEPPAELVAAVSSWPPPVALRTGGFVRSGSLVGEGTFSCTVNPAFGRLLTAVRADPWPAPDPTLRVA